jgi:rhodanese-related sulfurtransferase
MCEKFDAQVAQAKAEVSAVSPDEARAFRYNDPSTIFVDPRSAGDIDATTGIIPGAINVTLDDLSDQPDEYLPEELSSRSRTIITACQGGPLGAIAAYTLKQRGFNNVFYIDGGTQGWLDAGYATQK